jgi:aryl-alcohol dehydrogenase-like predicted oxidoreductase
MKISLGTANFLKIYSYKNTFISEKNSKKILNFLIKKKINLIDTSFDYDKFLMSKKLKNLKKFKISTKLVLDKKKIFNSKYFVKIEQILNKKIKASKIEKFESFFIHNFDQLNKNEIREAGKFLNKMRDKGIFKKIGASFYDISSIKKLKYLSNLKIVQVPINFANKQFLSKYFCNYLRKNNITLQARSIFLQGVLTDNLKNLKRQNFIDRNFLTKLDYWCKKNNISKFKYCLNFIKSHKNIDEIVVGVENTEQLNEIIKVLNEKKIFDYPKNLMSKNKRFIDPRKW